MKWSVGVSGLWAEGKMLSCKPPSRKALETNVEALNIWKLRGIRSTLYLTCENVTVRNP
jgi:hypothetical protein